MIQKTRHAQIRRKIYHHTQKKKYGTMKCKWCGKKFTRNHTRQQYCCTHCKHEATREHDRQWHQRYRQGKRLGTGRIGATRRGDEILERNTIRKEKRRLGLK